MAPDGIITTAAGNGASAHSGDGGPAVLAGLGRTDAIAVGRDGSLFVACRADGGSRVRRVAPDGTITTVAGSAQTGSSGDGGPATQAQLGKVDSLAVGPDGSMYIGETFSGNARVRRVNSALPGLTGVGEFGVPSEDGGELYLFDSVGRHLRTLDPLTGVPRYRFTYDGAGRLERIHDGHDNVTVVESDRQGRLAALIGPYGHRTALTTDDEGYLRAITNPAGEAVSGHQLAAARRSRPGLR